MLGKSPDKNPLKLLRQFRPELKRLLISDMLIRFCEQIPYAFVVLWCMKEIASPVTAVQFGVLTTIEMATAVLVYIPVAYFSDKTEKKPFVVMTFVFFTLFPLVLLFSQTFWVLVGAFVLRGLKEFGEPTRKALIIDLAVPGREAATFGTYYLFRDSVVAVAAFGGSSLVADQPGYEFSCGDGLRPNRDHLVCLVAQCRPNYLSPNSPNLICSELTLTFCARLRSYMLSAHSPTNFQLPIPSTRC